MLKHSFFLQMAIGASCFLFSCTPLTKTRESYIAAYQANDFASAEALLDKTIEKEIPEDKIDRSSNSVLLFADRGCLKFAAGDAKGAIEDFKRALDALDYYRDITIIDTACQILTQDDTAPFVGDDFEQLLIRIYFAMSLMQEGDYSNAYALLRQAEEWSQERTELYRKSPVTASLRVYENPLGKYLFAALLEKKGDLSNSQILYEQTCRLTNGVIQPPERNDNLATILVINHNGNAPFKYTEFSDASKCSLLALELFLGATNNSFCLSSLYGLPTPALAYYFNSDPLPTRLKINRADIPLLPIFDVDCARESELNEKMPIIVARGAARFILRRSAVAALERQDPLLGMVCDFGMLVANANTEADTRELSFLPRQFEIARTDVEPGSTRIEVEVASPFGPGKTVHDLTLKPKDLAVIHIFNIHPGITRVLIPPHFQETS